MFNNTGFFTFQREVDLSLQVPRNMSHTMAKTNNAGRLTTLARLSERTKRARRVRHWHRAACA